MMYAGKMVIVTQEDMRLITILVIMGFHYLAFLQDGPKSGN